jgi:hypothetical protein
MHCLARFPGAIPARRYALPFLCTLALLSGSPPALAGTGEPGASARRSTELRRAAVRGQLTRLRRDGARRRDVLRVRHPRWRTLSLSALVGVTLLGAAMIPRFPEGRGPAVRLGSSEVQAAPSSLYLAAPASSDALHAGGALPAEVASALPPLPVVGEPEVPPAAPQLAAPPPTAAALSPQPAFTGARLALSWNQLTVGGKHAVVRRTVGAAEGNLDEDGVEQASARHHIDPGNYVRNTSVYSYQFADSLVVPPGSTRVAEAEKAQLRKLKGHYETMARKAVQYGTSLDVLETIAGVDAANQAPDLVEASKGDYVAQLIAAGEKGFRGHEKILYARSWAFWYTRRQAFNAPGLRHYDGRWGEAHRYLSTRHPALLADLKKTPNAYRRYDKFASIVHDQERRLFEIEKVLRKPDIATRIAGFLKQSSPAAQTAAVARPGA